MFHRNIAVVACAVLSAACSKPEPRADVVRAVKTVTISQQSAESVREYAAEVRARTESRLGFRVGGKIARRSVDLGSTVAAGQVLAQLDPKDLQLGQEAASAGLAAAQANLDQANADHRRFKDLFDQGFISAAELERRETFVKSAQAQFEQARAQAGTQSNQAAYAALVADANGVITGVDAEPGMVVAAGAPVVRLAHDGPRDVVFSVPEDRVASIKELGSAPGALRVRVWGENVALHRAAIREIAAAADPVTRTFLVKADVGSIRGLRLGQTATVFIESPRIAGVTKLPLSALREDQGKSAVWVVDKASMTVGLRRVDVAGAEGNQAIIASGLEPGQTVVTAGVHVLEPGQKVKLYEASGAVVASPSLQRGGN